MPTVTIGTAQWGLDYGITNTQGQLSDAIIKGIVARLLELNLLNLDTASSYGRAELRIADLVPPQFIIQSKVPGSNAGQIRDRISDSLSRLNRDHIESVLIHDWFALSIEDKKLASEQLLVAQQQGLVSEIGISAYTTEDVADSMLYLPENINIQIPVNPLDQRFIGISSTYPTVKFQARSLFLQGLLIYPVGKFSAHSDLLKFQEFAESVDMTPLEAALVFTAQQSWLDSMIIAPTTLPELEQIIQYLASAQSERAEIDFTSCQSMDMSLIDPRTWN